MRHGDAQWKDPEVADSVRPRNRRGSSESETMGRRLSELTLVPDLIISSPARRAQQTAVIVARERALLPRSIRFVEALYLAGAQEILRLARTMGPRVPHLMIIGHNQGMSELANLLAPKADVGGLATAAFCSLTIATDQRSTVGPTIMQE